jgi:hypothetical protein
MTVKTARFVQEMAAGYDFTTIIIVTTIGFFCLAAILLVPVYLFLKREEKASENWTKESLRGPKDNGKASPEA